MAIVLHVLALLTISWATEAISSVVQQQLEATLERRTEETYSHNLLQSASQFQYVGFSESCLEFGAKKLPGTLFKDYAVPDNRSIDYLHKAGANLFRVPFLWERAQPVALGPFNETYMHLIDIVVERVTKDNGANMLLDVHNYARYYGQVLCESNVTSAMFADLWQKLATRYGSSDSRSPILFGLMNEPHDIKTESWVKAANAAIAAIRATGSKNYLTVCGNGYSGAHSWKTYNAEEMLKVSDPLDRVIFEPHQYLDSDSSGSHTECVSATIGVERMTYMTSWLRDNKKVAILGEFAGANNPTCHTAVTNLLNYMANNSDVWIGYSWWAAGPWWGNYMYRFVPWLPRSPSLAHFVRSMEPHIPPMLSWLTPYLE